MSIEDKFKKEELNEIIKDFSKLLSEPRVV